ncbi:MAG: hypothetical protein ACT4N9_01745 [Paracoccaceae bacterium]
MEPVLSATYTVAQLGIAQLSDGVSVIAQDGAVSLVLCGSASSTTLSLSLGVVEDPVAGIFVPEQEPGPTEAAMAQASGSMALQVDDGEGRLFIYGTGGALTLSVIGADGSIGAASVVSTSVGPLAAVTGMTVIPDASGDLAALTQSGQAGFQLFGIGSAGDLTQTDLIADTAKSYVADVADTASVVLGGRAIS